MKRILLILCVMLFANCVNGYIIKPENIDLLSEEDSKNIDENLKRNGKGSLDEIFFYLSQAKYTVDHEELWSNLTKEEQNITVNNMMYLNRLYVKMARKYIKENNKKAEEYEKKYNATCLEYIEYEFGTTLHNCKK